MWNFRGIRAPTADHCCISIAYVTDPLRVIPSWVSRPSRSFYKLKSTFIVILWNDASEYIYVGLPCLWWNLKWRVLLGSCLSTQGTENRYRGSPYSDHDGVSYLVSALSLRGKSIISIIIKCILLHICRNIGLYRKDCDTYSQPHKKDQMTGTPFTS